MFNVTKSAQAEIASYFKENELQPIRVFLFEGGCRGPQIAMGLDKERGNDAIYDFSGVQYLIDKEFLEKAAPVEIDYQTSGFKIVSSLRLGRGCAGCGSGDSCCS